MGTFDQIKKDIMDAMKAGRESGTSAYDTEAEVIRTSGSTAWVHIPGGVDETPVKMTIHSEPGDKVQVRVSGGSAWLVGNETAPPTDDTTAIEAKLKSLEADLNAKKAMQSAEDAALLAQTNAARMAEAVIAINSDIENLQDQIDGNITTWYYAYAPTLSNEPASTWTTTEEKNNHIGDIFYNSETGYSYRFMLNGSNYEWVRISDEDISAALEAASAAQDTADHKRRVFIARPTVPYDKGDLWCVGSSGDILTCTKAKTSSQSYAASDWSKLNKYTDDTVANAAAQAAASAQQSADSAAEAAQTAWNHADEANTAAQAAASAAESAQSSADSALQSASTANVAANSALTQLSVVEDVVDVLNWVSEHGSYKLTADTTVVEGKYYFTRSGTSPNYTYTVVTNPTGNPKTKGYYELDGVDEAVSNYVSSHLALTNQGLWVVNDNSSYKILLASDGMKVYDASGNLVSTFGESITFSSTRPQTIGNSSSYVKFYKDGSAWKIAISADAISLGSNAVATQSYADGKASTAETNAKNDTTNKLKSYYTKTQTDSAITQKANEIAVSVAETKIAEIDIGGRNLLLKTAEAHTSAGSTSGNVYITSYAQSDYLASMELVANENVFTLAFDYEVVGNTDENARMWPHFHGNAPTEANVIYSNTNRPGTSKVNMYVHDNPSGRYIVTFKVSSGQISGSANINRVRLNGATDGATIKVSNFKLELGNKATDWTPAPEDFEDYTDSAVTAAKAEIKVTTDGITSTVEKIGGFKYLVSETAGTTWTTFLSYAQEGKETLFTIESGALGCRIGDNVYLKYKDTTNNVFRYIRGTVIEQPTADNKIKLVAHGYEDIRPVDTIKSTINQSADSVKIQAKHVDIEGAAIFSSGRLSETSLDAAYDTKGAAGVVQENLDNLEIGGRNLLIDTNAPSLTKIAAISDRYWSNATSLVEDGTAEIVEINDSPVKGIKYGARFSATTQRTTKRTHELAFRNNTFEAGQTYTMSFWARLVSGGVNDVRFNFQNRTTAGIVDDCRYEPTSDWKKYSWTFTPTTKVENIVVYMGIAYLNIGIIEMCGFKVEKGNRATDWTSAPEEINHMINNVGLNGKNLLTGTNTVTTVTSTGTNANRTWRKDGDGTGTITHIDVTDAPYAILTNGWQFDITSVKGAAYANSLAIAQNAVNVVAGKTYTMSCYAKGTGKLYMFVGISTFIPSDESGKIASLTNDWKRYSITFTAPSNTAVVNANGTNAFFGANGTNVSLSICGMMLEEGDTATLWSPAPGDLAFEEQRIYYRSSVSTKPNGNGLPTAWVTENTNKWNAVATNADGWTKKVTPISDGKASGVTKFLYLFTCTQSRSISGEVTYSEILLDDSTTVIDGGNIITGTVTANQIAANTITADNILGQSLSIGLFDTTTKNSILNDNLGTGLGIKWNASTFDGAWNPGEAYFCKYDSSTGLYTDENGWVMFNGIKRTVAKGMQINPNKVIPFNTRTYKVLRLSSASATTGTQYYVWYNGGWKSSTPATPTVANIADWTWNVNTDIVLCSYVETANEAALVEYEQYTPVRTAHQVTIGNTAYQQAESAAKTASNYIVADSTGLMVAELNGSGETPSTATTNNVLIDSDSVDVRDGQTVLATFGTETAIYTKNGTELAHFGYGSGNAETGTSVQPYYSIGKRPVATENYDASKTYTKGDVVLYNGAPYVCCEDITTAEAWNADHWLKANAGNWSVAEGYLTVASGYASHAEGQKTMAAGTDAHAEGYKTVASGSSAHAEGGTTKAIGPGSHAEGVDTVASNSHSHAEGHSTIASGNPSHAEGQTTVASGQGSHAEGMFTEASGYASHAEGEYTIASGRASHARGYRTHATRQYQTVIGYLNELTNTDGADDAGKYIFVIGNGSSETERSNAFTVGWGGGVVAKGNGTFLTHKMVYEAGDVVDCAGVVCAGSLTGSNKTVQFFIFLPKPSTSGLKATLSGKWIIRHADGGYILNGNTLQSIGTVTAKVYELGIYVSIALSNASSFTNNCPVVVHGGTGPKITFSA